MKVEEIIRLLPWNFQQTVIENPRNPLHLYLRAMETLHAPDEYLLSNLDEYFDPYRTPDEMLPFLAEFFGLAHLLELPPVNGNYLSTGNGRLRNLIAHAMQLGHSRGTRAGLLHFLRLATGVSETSFLLNERAAEFHLEITVPTTLAAHQPLLERIIEDQKPAYMTATLYFQERQETQEEGSRE
jgi:phage tail-like protein